MSLFRKGIKGEKMLNLPDIFLARWVLDSYISQTYFISLQTASDLIHPITVSIITTKA
jgi:hypothetical protein